MFRGLLPVCAVLLLSGCAKDQAANPDLRTAVAEIGDVRDVVPATGELIEPGSAEIRAARPGVIRSVLVQEGQRVRAGQVLATLVAPARGPAQAEAVAGAEAASASIQEARIAVATAQSDFDRKRELQDRGFVSAAGVANARSSLESAQASLQRIERQAEAARARVRLQAAEDSSYDVVATQAGTVTLALARPGMSVGPEDERPLFQTSAGGKKLILEIMVPEPDMYRVSMDSQVRFVIDGLPDSPHDARLLSIGQAPIREGRFTYYRALAEYDNSYGIVVPGMSASVELIRANSRRVLRIPAKALHYRPSNYLPPLSEAELNELKREFGGNMSLVRAAAGGEEFGSLLRSNRRLIFVLSQGKPERRLVGIGGETDDFIEITDGLRPGDVVILPQLQIAGAAA